MSHPFESNLNTSLELNFAQYIYDDWVREHFPTFQQSNRSRLGADITIDFSRCEWMSPLPLLLIGTEIMSYSIPGRRIDINLGSGSDTDKGAAARGRALKYLAQNGFLEIFLGRNDLNVRYQFDSTGEGGSSGTWFSGPQGLRTLRPSLERLNVELLYGESIVLPAETWKLPKLSENDLTESLRAKIKSMLRQADNALFKFKAEARKYRDVTLQRLTQILLELVENAAEHAYAPDVVGYVGIYARIRNFDSDWALENKARELARSPLLGRVLLSSKQKQIELFVVDVGRGLFAEINSWAYVEHSKIVGQPLRHTASMLFMKPMSRHDRKLDAVSRVRGSSTGLVHLDAILRHQNDSTRIVTGNEWLAGTHPRPPGFQDNAPSTGGYIQQRDPFHGTIFHVGLSPSVIPELNSQWFTTDRADSVSVRESIIQKFGRTKPRQNLDSNVIDIRGGEGLESVQARVKEVSTRRSGTVVRVNRIAEKNLVNRVVVAWIQGCANATRPASSLFLCELGRYQAVDTQWVIEHLFSQTYRIELSGNVPSGLSIFLVTEDLCCTSLNLEFKPRRDGRFQVDISRPTANITKLDNRLVYLLDELRARDSFSLWKRAKELSTSIVANPALLQQVLWSSADGYRVLPYYVNFSVLIQDEEAARTIRRSLRRILALFPFAHGLALDRLVDAPLHDALKWLILPPQESTQRVLVGSLSVSGSTLRRYIEPHKTVTVGMIDCLRTPYFERASQFPYPYLAALLWDPELSVHTNEAPKYRRIGRSAYVEPMDSPSPGPVYDELLYSELETAKLLKFGHWQQGQSHSLLEINAQMALEQSNASESGPIPWLVDRIAELCQRTHVVLAFPLEKLAYRLAHHIRTRLANRGSCISNLILLPISFMPRMAGGLTRFAPLVVSAARELANRDESGKPTAVFLDVGFISMRTMRHSVRQLTDAGFDKIRVLGVINRSSAPELASERSQNLVSSAEYPQTYWRWNVPVLGASTHCPLCAALPGLGRLSRLISETHFDLVALLQEVNNAWTVRDITDCWEDFGLSPVPIREHTVTSLADWLVRMGIKQAYSSTVLTSQLIEYLRTTGDTEMPHLLVKYLDDLKEYDLALESLCAVLLLASDGLQQTDLHEYVSTLVRLAFYCGSDNQLASTSPDRYTTLMGLVALVFSVQPVECKFAVLPDVVSYLSNLDIVRAPSLRLAILALTTDSDVSSDVQRKFSELCTWDRDNLLLSHNYHSVRPSRSNASESWDKLTQAFGRSPGHSQQSELGNLKLEFTRSANLVDAVPRLKRLASLLAQSDRDFVMNTLGTDSREIINEVYKLETSIRQEGLSAVSFNERIEQTFGPISNKLHKSLVRYGDRAKSPLVYDVFFEMLDEQANLNGLVFLEDIVPSVSATTSGWPKGVGDYFPLGDQVGRLFGEIFSNIHGKSDKRPPPMISELADCSSHALAWIWFDLTLEPVSKGLTVVIITGLSNDRTVTPYNPKVTGIADFGVKVSSNRILTSYFEIRIRVPSLASILETL